MFAVVRHPDIDVPGVLPEAALEFQRHQGWYRVSDFAASPADLDPGAYGPDSPDLDADPDEESDDEPKSKTRTARKATAKTTSTEENEA